MPLDLSIQRLAVYAFEVPTDGPEEDATLAWDSTTMVLVEMEAGGVAGIGYTYASRAAAVLIEDLLFPAVAGEDARNIPRCWRKMLAAVRNQGAAGLSAMAISAVDNALWDLKARLLELPVCDLLGRVRDGIDIYGSGGFTNYSDRQLRDQLKGWVDQGLRRVKIKVGPEVKEAKRRVEVAREAVGDEVELFTDANSAFLRREALRFLEETRDLRVTWLEQPLPPEDLDGMRWLRERAPAGVEIADGEYGHDAPYFRRMLEAGAVNFVMPDATRCGGVSGFLEIAGVAAAYRIPMSSHCAPLLHAHLGCSVHGMGHAEYFHDHARLESMFFDGGPRPVAGQLRPSRERPGWGVDFKWRDALKYQIYGDKR